MYRFYFKKGSLIFAAVLLIIMSMLLVSCAGSSKTAQSSMAVSPSEPEKAKSGGGVSYDQAMPAESGAPVPAPSQEGMADKSLSVTFGESVNSEVKTADLQKDRKLIMDGNVYMETLDFDTSVQKMDQLIKDYGGFAETRTVRGKSSNSRALRSANYVIRVPADSFQKVLESMGSIGTVLESNSQGTDITDQYYDSQTRVKSLKVQEQTLLDILAKAEKLEDVITLESRLSDIRYQIESIENTIKNYDRLVAYSRITINIQEVDEATETPPVEKKLNVRMASAFSQSLKSFRIGFENFLVWFVGSWITLLFLAFIIVVIWFITKRRRIRKITPVKKNDVEAMVDDKNKKE